MSRQQLENIQLIPSLLKPVWGPKKPLPLSRSKKRTPTDEIEKNEMTKIDTQKLQT